MAGGAGIGGEELITLRPWQVPTNLKNTFRCGHLVPCQSGWLLRPLRSRKGMNEPLGIQLDDRVARKQVGGREQIEGKKSEVTEDE